MPLVATRGAASAQGFGEFGAVTAPAVYIEDVFSTYLYTGNVSTQTITNNIDLSGKGGLVWTKSRSISQVGRIYDTVRGAQYDLIPSLPNQQALSSPAAINFSSSGFGLVADNSNNQSGVTYASWTFREQAKFFDVVTYTGNGSNRTISHNLGSVPGCIIVKRTDTSADWQVYHRSLANTEYMVLNSIDAKATGTTRWNSTTPTSTVFSLGTDTTVNANGGTYVAYLFAHDAGGFGLTGTDNVISCGLITGNTTVNLGWEPQWVLTKETNSASNWFLIDNMRGFQPEGASSRRLLANGSNEESDSSGYAAITSTGFSSSVTQIYIAIRRGPMRVPTSGTSVFSANAYSGGTANRSFSLGFVPDALLTMRQNTSNFDILQSRLTGLGYMFANASNAEISASTGIPAWDAPTTTLNLATATSVSGWNASGSTYVNEAFARAPGFFDVVCDTGTGSAHTITHNLGAVPELMIRKKRSAADNWIVYANNDNTDYLVLNTTAATVDDNTMWNDTSPTSSVFTVGTNDDVNGSGATFVTYLFASVSGVSKVGSYTGSGTTKQIDCGFTGGARFVLIKRTDSTGDWYVWDTARGIVSGNDPYLLLNSNAAEVTNTDYVDTYSAGFEISSTAPAAINANGGTFIFLAIA